MKLTNKILLIISSIILLLVLLDISIRLFYCTGISLLFNSQEFNNITSPIISFFGFVGLIITVVITLNQFKLQQSSSYFDYYRNSINKFLTEKTELKYDTIQLLDFLNYSSEKYDELKKIPEYRYDLANFKQGMNVSSDGKSYDVILGNIRYFHSCLFILLKRYELFLNEILNHKSLSEPHRDLLLKEFFENQITKYTTSLAVLELIDELKEVKENLYTAFIHNPEYLPPFYNSDFYKLKQFVEEDERLKKYLENNAH